jgi:integrase
MATLRSSGSGRRPLGARHAAESEAIPGNPLSLVRPPKANHRDAVRPLSPLTVEAIRSMLLNPPPREVAAAREGQRPRRRYALKPPGTPQTRRRDALIVSLLAYAGLRPGELRGMQLGDAREHTLLIQRAANPDGSIKATKNERDRTVRLLSPLAMELREYRLAAGRPSEGAMLLCDDDSKPWDKSNWQMWRVDRWAPAAEPRALTRSRARTTCAIASPRSCSQRDASRSTSPSNSGTRSLCCCRPTRT